MDFPLNIIFNYRILIVISLFITNVEASEIKASSFGYNSSDATTALKNALNSSYDTIIIDKQSGPWKIGPLSLIDLSNKVIIIESGVIIEGITSKFYNSTDALFKFIRPNNITINGYGSTFKMDTDNLIKSYSRTEHRHSLSILGGQNVKVNGLNIDGSGGDGIYIARYNTTNSKNITIKDVISKKNARDGISVISADGLYISNSEFNESYKGILGCGVNFEPNTTSDTLKDIIFKNCKFIKNYYSGIQISTLHLNGSSATLDITIEDSYISNNSYLNSVGAAEINIGVGSSVLNPAKGRVDFINTKIENAKGYAISSKLPSNSFSVDFTNTILKNVAIEKGSPIILSTNNYSNNTLGFGNISFNNTEIEYSRDSPFTVVYASKTNGGMYNVNGSFTIVNKALNVNNVIKYDNVFAFNNVKLQYKFASILPSDIITPPVTSNCSENLNLSITETKPFTKSAQRTITSTSSIVHSISGTSTYSAGEKITLKPGFRTNSSSNKRLVIKNEPCTSSLASSSLKASLIGSSDFFVWPLDNDTELAETKAFLTENPVQYNSYLRFETETDEIISINVFNLQSILVKQILTSKKFTKGTHDVKVDFSSLNTGLYIVSLQKANETIAIKALKK
ncbi:right-handed parallel beta-helix repeat-containing protein [Cellulophaga baltica]|uniref:Por secretion system C-terminal sorting domain-containing protein n=1 Tax=Cellulophaga baltica TaxID=76594 RepID=A0A1G7K1L3_9FLAO|nr:right-handed parallel beta-helix repeat-containing protein [Cellulophaga baltica]SDF31025.1 Por secretion system C-terminal sorting domain-containing protein [Cellulophaga baltica]